MKSLVGIILALLMIITISSFSVNITSAQEIVKPEALTLTVYPDGTVYVDYRVTVDPSYPRVNITVFGKTVENLIVTDGEGYPLDYMLLDGVITVDSLGAYEIKISYTTKDLVTGYGKFLTLKFDSPVDVDVVLSPDVSLVSLNQVPVSIQEKDRQTILTMPKGPIELTFEVALVVKKNPSTITISVSPLKVNVGEEVTVKGKITPPQASVEVTVTYTKAGKIKVTHTVKTSLNGTFTDTIKPDAGGTWTVQASWEGSWKYDGAVSEKVSFEAVEKRCIIATVTYGSELAEEVQFLRGFREAIVYQTYAGSSFMVFFNSWYYSWSPYVADFIRQNQQIKPLIKALMYPLLGILHSAVLVYSAFNFNSEVGIILAGLVAGSLIGLVYIAPILMIVLTTLRRKLKQTKIGLFKILTVLWALSLCVLVLADILKASVFLTVSSAMFVVLTIVVIGVGIPLKLILKCKFY